MMRVERYTIEDKKRIDKQHRAVLEANMIYWKGNTNRIKTKPSNIYYTRLSKFSNNKKIFLSK